VTQHYGTGEAAVPEKCPLESNSDYCTIG